MEEKELMEIFDKQDNFISSCALIEHQGVRGIAIELGENLSEKWRSREIIVFWRDGDHTVLPEEFVLIKFNFWDSP